MIKRSLLASSITLAMMQTATAAPLAPIDARGMGMGGTGVASAKLAHAPQYNPALLSTAHEDDDFAVVFPQIGVNFADEDEFIDTIDELDSGEYANDEFGNPESLIDHFTTITESLSSDLGNLTTSVEALDTALAGGNPTAIKNASSALQSDLVGFTNSTQDLQDTTFDLTSELDKLSGSGLRVNGGANGAIAIPSKKFGAAISFGAQVFASGRTIFTPEDQNLINAYAEGVNEYTQLTADYVNKTVTFANSTETANQCIADNGAPACSSEIAVANADGQAAVDAQNEVNAYSKEANGSTIISVNNGTVNVDENPSLTSQAQVVAIAVAELGLTLSREFEIAGHSVAIGVTPKLQQVVAYDYTGSLEEDDSGDSFDESEVTDTEVKFSAFNLDAGAAYQFGDANQWQVGLVAKNLISKEYETENNLGNNTKINLDTQFRAGVSHTTDWTVVAVDLDLMENDPIAFEAPTQYASIGAEFDLFDTLQLRAGYRNNLSESDASVVSVGLGVSPFGVHFDLAAMANPSDPKKEAGVAMEFGFYF